ncbi:MAG TPA: RdgB/HAM1 family non-canonical purine NTP pyrophosphatase [Pyrinomonadaceae bacterium]|nr:RdgB/HAM1 family non-canonical purine NTP pyrophosphatase [Pyrinomonadaceae bacterium]
MNEHTELLVATNNAGKVGELSQLLSDFPLRLRLLGEFPDIEEAEETGETFAENATIKALYYSARTGLLTLSDDSGLAVDALDGAPGVYSARYAGREATYAERMSKLLGELEATGDAERRARFVCVIAVADPTANTLHTFEGECRGRIAHAPRGTGGFGYDPLFIPDGYDKTFGELPAEVKHTLSHRARALRQAARHFRERYT